jgi:hypothetical protein
VSGGLPHVLGLDPGYWQAFWSGFGSCLTEFTIVGALFAYYKHHTCHVSHPRFCWRPGIHLVAGTPYRTCGKHHPQVPERISAEHIAAASQDTPIPEEERP